MTSRAAPARELTLVRRERFLDIVCSCCPQPPSQPPDDDDETLTFARSYGVAVTCHRCGATTELALPDDDPLIQELSRAAGAELVHCLPGEHAP
jgi:hypothetical protein